MRAQATKERAGAKDEGSARRERGGESEGECKGKSAGETTRVASMAGEQRWRAAQLHLPQQERGLGFKALGLVGVYRPRDVTLAAQPGAHPAPPGAHPPSSICSCC